MAQLWAWSSGIAVLGLGLAVMLMLDMDGPATQTSIQISNGQASQSATFVYRLTPRRVGEFTIPAATVANRVAPRANASAGRSSWMSIQ